MINIQTGASAVSVTVTDINGKRISSYKFSNTLNIETAKLPPGVYFIKATSNKKTVTQKVVVME